MWAIAASPSAELKWCQKRFRTVLPAWGPGPPSTGSTTVEKLEATSCVVDADTLPFPGPSIPRGVAQ